MFRQRTEDQHIASSEGGVRHLFVLDHFEFHDTLDDEGAVHHFVLEFADDEEEGEPAAYETDRATMYELMARYLAGEYEKEEYDLDISPAHEALLDLLEMAAARARSGEFDFSLEDLEEEFGEEAEEEEQP